MDSVFISEFTNQGMNVDIRFKDKVWWWRWVSLLKGQFGKDLTASLVGNTIWYPSYGEYHKLHHYRRFEILAHEYVHVAQKKRVGRWMFGLLYGFPQNVFPTVGVLIVLLGGNVWLGLATMCLALVPFSGYWRVMFEEQAYRMSVLVRQVITAEQMAWLPRTADELYQENTDIIVNQLFSRIYSNGLNCQNNGWKQRVGQRLAIWAFRINYEYIQLERALHPNAPAPYFPNLEGPEFEVLFFVRKYMREHAKRYAYPCLRQAGRLMSLSCRNNPVPDVV
jgi:hypothetical protein